MFNWFKKKADTSEAAAAAPGPPLADSLPNNAPLVALIHQMKLDTLMGDMRPMHRAILGSELLLPLHEPPQNGRLRFMTFQNDTTLCAFTDAERMRAFLAGGDLGDRVAIAPLGGETLCEMAMRSELELFAINPGSDAHYAMPPHVFRVLAHGYVPSSVADEEIKSVQIAIARPMSGLPSQGELDAWRRVLAENNADAAYWFNVMLDDVKELRYAIGVACAPDAFTHLQNQLVQAWFGLWPVNTPLYVIPLGEDETSQAVRQGGAPIYP